MAADPVLSVSKPGGVSPPSVITKIDPQYSEIARIAKYSCTVLLSIVVDAQGIPG
jgi:periplasmic protein TonB